ncbi:hypothetical protein ACKTEK_13785 [Tepidamorphus sp. 3E244]|uniref:hypothetical protein n=1 Tax=Tepidamorphus sp. 3E244 TaxID=3385498 RepID=UPI0038FC58BE
MKRNTKILTSALLAATMLSGPALADSANKPYQAGKQGEVSQGANANANANANARMNAGNNQGDVVSSIRSSNSAKTDLGTVTSDSDVSVVAVKPASDSSAKAIDNAINDNSQSIDQLRASVKGNTALVDKLEAQGYSADSVVAARSHTDGSVTIYVR